MQTGPSTECVESSVFCALHLADMSFSSGHVLACAAITVAAHAAGRIESEALPIHALFLLACAVPLRLLLALSAQNHDTTLSLSRK